jgi:membrane protease YdiL (CAAX protease family)
MFSKDPASRAQHSPAPSSAPLAPPWHTALLIALMLGVATIGTLLSRGGAVAVPVTRGRIGAVYLPLLVVEWGLTLYVARIGRPRNALGSLLGRGWNSARRACADVALAAAGGCVIEASEAAFGAWRNAAISAMVPHAGAERVVWVFVAASVGFCEEVVYRGYVQTQLAAFTRSSTAAIVLQATLFGIAHGEQGAAVAIRFAVYAVGFGALARWRQSLVPGILCHAAIDIASGLLA